MGARAALRPPARVRADYVAELLAVTPRAVQIMAKRGELPGAAQVGKLWTFDLSKLLAHIAEREEAACRATTFTKGAKSGGSELPSLGSSDAKAYEQAMQKLLGQSATRR
jgi:hypothetical protein